MMLRNLVVATDFSDGAAAATEWAAVLASRHGATLTLLHALPLPPPAMPHEESLALAPRTAAREELETSARRLADRGIDVRTALLESSAAGAITEKASELGADLVVTGATGKTGFERLVLGSVAADIVQRSPCPVLTVKAHSSPVRLRCILAPVDFSRHSLSAVETALALFPASIASRLVLVHVLPRPAGFYRYGQPPEPPPSIVEDRERQEARLADFAREFSSFGHSVEARVRMGDAATEIEEEASVLKPDVIAMGTHGRNAIGRVLLGSTTRHILPRVPCPVLTLHRSEDR